MWDEPATIRYASIESLLVDDDMAPSSNFDDAGELRQLRDPSRRRTWIAGRTLALQVLLEQRPDWATGDTVRVEIHSRNAAGQSVRPDVFINGLQQDVSLSISHTDRGVLVAVSFEGEVGVDLVDCEQFTANTLTPWFTDAERRHLDKSENSAHEQATLWAVKEAVYKVVNDGKPFAPKSFDVLPAADGIIGCRYRGRSLDDDFRIRVDEMDGHIAAIAVANRTTNRVR